VTDPFRAYRPWFWAAVFYNLTWGISVVVHPRWFLWSANITASATPLAQAAGMMVAVYAYGYYLLARDPVRYAPFIWIALAGKMFGAIGYVVSALAGALPWRFGVVTVMNDVIWLPAFCAFALRYARRPT
jgi:hypothetical protein